MASTWNAGAAAERGAGLFDRQVPDWLGRVDEGRLELADPCNCPVGQLFGEYGWGAMKLGLHFPETVTFGFTVNGLDFPNDADCDAAWRELNTAWRELIARRRLALISQREAVAA